MNEDRAARAAQLPLICGVLACIAPLVATQYLPFTDLPEHVAAMATIARYSGGTADAGIYELAFGSSPYLLYHCLGALGTKLTGDAVEANRILLLLVAIAYPGSLFAALRSLGRDPRLAVFACMPMLGRSLFVGLLPYVASVPLYLFGVALIASRAKATSKATERWQSILLAVLAVALFFSHLSALVVFVATALALDVVLSLQAGFASLGAWAMQRLRASLWLVPLAIVASVFATNVKVTMRAESLSTPGEIARMGSLKALYTLPLWAFDIFRSHVDEACAVLWWVALIALAILGLRSRGHFATQDSADDESQRNEIAAPSGLLRRIVARVDPCYIPLVCALVVYVAMPFRVGAGTMLNVRLAPIVILASVLTVRGPTRGRGVMILAGAGALVTAIYSANAVHQIRILSARYMDGFDVVLASMRPGSKVVTLSFDTPRAHETHFQPYPYAGSYHRVHGGGVASYSFTEMNHWSVHYREGATRPPTKTVPLWVYKPCTYRNTIDGVYYDYVLVVGDVDPFASTSHPTGPRFRRLPPRTPAIALYEKVSGEEVASAASDAPCAATSTPCCRPTATASTSASPSPAREDGSTYP